MSYIYHYYFLVVFDLMTKKCFNISPDVRNVCYVSNHFFKIVILRWMICDVSVRPGSFQDFSTREKGRLQHYFFIILRDQDLKHIITGPLKNAGSSWIKSGFASSSAKIPKYSPGLANPPAIVCFPPGFRFLLLFNFLSSLLYQLNRNITQ